MQQQELDVAAGNEAGDVVVEELVDAFEVPVISVGGRTSASFVSISHLSYNELSQRKRSQARQQGFS